MESATNCMPLSPAFSQNSIDIGMAVDPAPPSENFGHYDFLILQFICHKMRAI